MKKLVITALVFAPTMAFAQNLGNIESLLKSIGKLIDIALPIVVAVGLLAFFWGLVKFIFGGESAKDEGKSLMLWGIVALFLMVSVWGIVKWIGFQVGIGQGDTIIVPSVPLKN